MFCERMVICLREGKTEGEVKREMRGIEGNFGVMTEQKAICLFLWQRKNQLLIIRPNDEINTKCGMSS